MGYIEIWSPNKYDGNGGYRKNVIVVHTSEPGPYGYHKFPGTAESLGNYLSNPSVQASYQLCVDRNGDVCRMVGDEDRAWAAGNITNNEGLHICAVGWSALSREEWLDFPKQLDQMAVEIARWCKLYDIPAVKLTPDQLTQDQHGVAGHGDVANAWHETTHTDPGWDFPYDYVLGKVNEILGQGAPSNNEGDISVSAGDDIVTQFMGPERTGWKELAPQKNPEGKSFSIFKFLGGKEPNVDRQTLVEAIATLVFEATLRIKPYRGNNIPKNPETVLGHAAAAAGIGLDNQEVLIALAEAHQDLCRQVNAKPNDKLQSVIDSYRNLDRNKISPLDPQWTPPAQ